LLHEIVNLGVLEQFLNHISRHNLCKTTDKILLAVSGGIDSMVMLHLFKCAGFSIGVVHCNFQLRGLDSMADEALIKSDCEQYHTPFFVKRFDTKRYANDNGLSIQMAARELRYTYFKHLLAEHSYDYLATAHHLDDVLETVLLNVVKGSGIEGISGIPVKVHEVIRPLLYATKEQIRLYAIAEKLAWREDASNNTQDYQRNFLRHEIVPRLKEINPSLQETFRNTLERLVGANELLKIYLNNVRLEAFQLSREQLSIAKINILKTPAPAVLLWELIKEMGFNFEQCQDMVKEHQSGKIFLSSTHQLTVDRQHFIIQPTRDKKFAIIHIQSTDTVVENGLDTLNIAVVGKDAFQLVRSPEIAQLDIDKIEYPLVWRPWKAGDFFVPFGMNQSKKLSDFFIDIKLSRPEKDKVTVIESKGTIIWVVGWRIHDHFKVTEHCRNVLTIKVGQDKR
jgi:tRNA(Ile)-lysidine synthase